MPLRVCNEPGCPELTDGPRCEAHRKQDRKRSDAKRPSPRVRGYDAEHEADRAAYFAAFPICQWHEGCIERATDLDHIDGNPFNRDWSNYRGYCHSHHSRRTARDQKGGWNARA